MEPGQAVSAGAVLTQAQGQLQMARPGGEAEQRSIEEQEVLYNMTGQTGSLMYMAPEVYFVNHLEYKNLDDAVIVHSALHIQRAV